MYYATRRGYLNVILLLVIILSLMALSAWVSYNTGLNASEKVEPQVNNMVGADAMETNLTSISLAENANLQRASGLALVDKTAGNLEVDVILPEGAAIPEGSVLAGWLVDAGKLGGIGESSVSAEDQKYGTPYANVDFSESSDNMPFALSLGTLLWSEERASYYLFYKTHDLLNPYDAVMITLESDANINNYDPRPGTPVLIGEIGK